MVNQLSIRTLALLLVLISALPGTSGRVEAQSETWGAAQSTAARGAAVQGAAEAERAAEDAAPAAAVELDTTYAAYGFVFDFKPVIEAYCGFGLADTPRGIRPLKPFLRSLFPSFLLFSGIEPESTENVSDTSFSGDKIYVRVGVNTRCFTHLVRPRGRRSSEHRYPVDS
jgi:hypothetical protein